MDNKFKNEKNFLSSYPDSISGVFDDKNIVLTFPAAYSYQKIYNYKIEIIDNEKGEKVKSLYLSSLFYKYPTPADMPREYSIDIELEPPFSNDYTIEITAADSWGNISEPLVFKG